MVAYNGKLFFNGYDGVHGEELWVYDPIEGATLVADFIPGVGGTGDDDPEPPSSFNILDGKFYFSAYDSGIDGKTWWTYDPIAGPVLVGNELWAGTGITQFPHRPAELDGRLYFAARDGEHGRELWVHNPECLK